MIHRLILLLCMVAILCFGVETMSWAEDTTDGLDAYLRGYNYDSRSEMKANSEMLLDWLEDGKAVLVDIRFAEEQQVWSMGFGLKIPLNQLPERLAELPKDKIIVTACPHKDRAIIAMTYLRSMGYNARYLTDGLIGLAENLRGDDAKYFMELLPKE